MSEIVVVGSLNMDETIRVDRLPGPGETVVGLSVARTPGGKGANQAVAAARLAPPHVRVRMAGMVGADEHGVAMTQDLSRSGVDIADVHVIQEATSGVALITVDTAGENTIVLAPGVNHEWPPGIVDSVPVAAGDVVLCQLEIPLPVIERLVHRACSASARVVLNAAPPHPLPDALLQCLEVLVVNEHEARIVLGAAPTGPEELDTLRGDLDCDVVVTLGARGALVRPRGAASSVVPAFPVDPISTVGAGDAFVGALAVDLLAGRSLLDGVVRACAVGALATTAAGARGSIPTIDEVDELLGRQPC